MTIESRDEATVQTLIKLPVQITGGGVVGGIDEADGTPLVHVQIRQSTNASDALRERRAITVWVAKAINAYDAHATAAHAEGTNTESLQRVIMIKESTAQDREAVALLLCKQGLPAQGPLGTVILSLIAETKQKLARKMFEAAREQHLYDSGNEAVNDVLKAIRKVCTEEGITLE